MDQGTTIHQVDCVYTYLVWHNCVDNFTIYALLCSTANIIYIYNIICAADCREGRYFADSSLISCRQCKRGYYQDRPWQFSCIECPPSTTTVSVRSTSETDCKRECVHTHVYQLHELRPCVPGFIYKYSDSKKLS